MAAGWTRWRRRDVVRGRFDATSLWSSFREAVTGPLPVTKPNHVELVPGPRILETSSKTLSKSAYSRLPSLTGVGRLRRPHISEAPLIRKKKPVEVPDDEAEAYIDPRD